MDDVADVRHPGVEPIAVGGRHPVGETGAPVVADQVDRAVDPVELADHPVDVVVLGRTEAVGSRAPEAGERQRHRLPVEGLPDLTPDGGGLGDTVHEDDHAATLPVHYRLAPSDQWV
jgi:hypothetical protein